MPVLIIADHNNTVLNSATCHTIMAGLKIAKSVNILVAGLNIDSVVEEVKLLQGVGKVLTVDSPLYEYGLAENMTELVLSFVDEYSHIFAPDTLMGQGVIPRLSALKDCGAIANICEVIDKSTFKKLIYAGSAIATEKSSDNIIFATVRSVSFEAVKKGNEAVVEKVKVTQDMGLTTCISLKKIQIVVSVLKRQKQ